jgi:hypothetical protein
MLLEDYALIGDMQTATPVDRNGCTNWYRLPRLGSGRCLSSLLGAP